jgi:peptide/nickel transport system ATP-binding protein
MTDLQQRFGMTYLLISHDLAVVDHLCAQVLVMRGGEVVERGASDEVFGAPQHAYTRALVSAASTI